MTNGLNLYNAFRVIVILGTSLFLISCSTYQDSNQNVYVVEVYDENIVNFTPPQKYREQFGELLHSPHLKSISYSHNLPEHFEQSPIIIVSKAVGHIELETSSYEELFDFFRD
ncbi:hypothetical protein ACFFH4_20795 [Halalkalibacter alkalisediminis]|uniref:Uncharacterized protein n=1 Tax=Halalkalibacter alkalisediminis TaxID=935616 RepID=A0ABV6NM99_9BACI